MQEYLELVEVGDAWKEERIRMVLSTEGVHDEGLLSQAADISSSLQPSRRFAMIKFIMLLVQREPAVGQQSRKKFKFQGLADIIACSLMEAIWAGSEHAER